MEYRTDYRNTSLLFPAIMTLLLAWFGSIAFVLFTWNPEQAVVLIAISAAIVLIAMVFLSVTVLRVHIWLIDSDGLHISEGPRVRFTGFSREAHLAFSDIAGVERRENLRDHYLDVVTHGGKRFRLPQAVSPSSSKFVSLPDPDRDLGVFLIELRAASRKSGHDLPGQTEALGYYATFWGLAVLFIVFLLTLALAVAALWAQFGGADLRAGTARQSGEAFALLLVFPFILGWMLVKSWRQRRRELSAGRPNAALPVDG